MGCCSDKKSITEKHEETPNERRNLKTIQTTVTYNNISTTKIEVKSKEKEEDIKKLQEEFINDFMEKTEIDEEKLKALSKELDKNIEDLENYLKNLEDLNQKIENKRTVGKDELEKLNLPTADNSMETERFNIGTRK